MPSKKVTGDIAGPPEQRAVDASAPAADADAQPAEAMAAAALEVDLPPPPSIPSGQADNDPPRPEAPLSLPPAAPPPSGQPASELQTEPASLEPPGAIAAEPMAPAPRQAGAADRKQPPLAVEEVQPRADVSPQPEAARAPELPPALSDEAPAVETVIDPFAVASAPAAPARRGEGFADAVTLLEISPAQVGGITETPLPGNRAGSPPAPLAAPRIGWSRPTGRWVAYALIVLALTVLFLWLLVYLFRAA